jgi:hypothetical protein
MNDLRVTLSCSMIDLPLSAASSQSFFCLNKKTPDIIFAQNADQRLLIDELDQLITTEDQTLMFIKSEFSTLLNNTWIQTSVKSVKKIKKLTYSAMT